MVKAPVVVGVTGEGYQDAEPGLTFGVAVRRESSLLKKNRRPMPTGD